MTNGTITLIRDGEECGTYRFKTRKEMSKKITEIRKQVEQAVFPSLYEISIILNYDKRNATKSVS